MQRPEEARAKAEVKREVMRTGTGTRQTFSITADGTTRHFDYAIEPWRAPDGSVIGVTCAAFETQQDKAETQNE